MKDIARLSIERPLYSWMLTIACIVGGLIGGLTTAGAGTMAGAAAGAAILCSDLRSHLDLKELNLGVEYFEESNWKDFESKITRLLEDRDYLEQLKLKSKKNIKNYSWEKRFESLMEFSVRSSTG